MKIIEYIGNCTHLELNFLNELQENNKEITYNTIVKNLGVKYLNNFFGYNTNILKLKNDYHVRFYRSSFICENKKVKVFIVVHSAIEYVFQVKISLTSCS